MSAKLDQAYRALQLAYHARRVYGRPDKSIQEIVELREKEYNELKEKERTHKQLPHQKV